MSHTMTRGSTLMDKHFSRLVEVYPFLYHMRMHCQNSLFCKKTIGLHCGCQKQTFLESDFTLRLSLANLSGNSGLKSKLSFCNIQCILKLCLRRLVCKLTIFQYQIHTKNQNKIVNRNGIVTSSQIVFKQVFESKKSHDGTFQFI